MHYKELLKTLNLIWADIARTRGTPRIIEPIKYPNSKFWDTALPPTSPKVATIIFNNQIDRNFRYFREYFL